ncbi:LysM domain-containing protein, partial [Acinetobacter baumannii]
GGTYVATREDNDWTIAHKYGVKVKDIRALNPNIEWNRLRPGAKIVVPGRSSAQIAMLQSKKITTHYARLAGQNVNVRQKPT